MVRKNKGIIKALFDFDVSFMNECQPVREQKAQNLITLF